MHQRELYMKRKRSVQVRLISLLWTRQIEQSEYSETATVPNRGCTSGWGYRVVSILASADHLREVKAAKHQTRAIGELHASKVG